MQLPLLSHITYDRKRVFRNARVKVLEKSSSNKRKKTKNKWNKRKRSLNWINRARKVFILESAKHLTSDVSLLDVECRITCFSYDKLLHTDEYSTQFNTIVSAFNWLIVKELLTLNHNSLSSTETGMVRKLSLSSWFRNSTTFVFYVT